MQPDEELPVGMRPEWAAAAAGRVAKLAGDIQYVIDRAIAIRRAADTRWSGPDKDAYAQWSDSKGLPTLLDTQTHVQKLGRTIQANLEQQTAKSKASNFGISA
jgi:hypothetical protein